MKFKTEVELCESGFTLNPGDEIVLLGSCFSDEIGRKLHEDKFNCSINPFGVLYNPASILQALQLLTNAASGKNAVDDGFTGKYLFCKNGYWRSWLHSSAFIAKDKDTLAEIIGNGIAAAAKKLKTAKMLVLTFGTNRAYIHKTGNTDSIVANCHKQPDKEFKTVDLGIEEIRNGYVNAISGLRQTNPEVHVLFTVSPYRYTKYGLHGSNLSKATLLLAENEITTAMPETCQYFPSYEILNDELRDYRFYAEDIVHPSSQAVSYIYEKVEAQLFSDKAKTFAQEWRPLKKTLQHRPADPNSNEYHILMQKTQKAILALKSKYPETDFKQELHTTEQYIPQ